MFSRCNKLSSAPFLPAATLAPHCYSDMFNMCSSLRVYENTGENLIFKCPMDLPEEAVERMFSATKGPFTQSPTPGNSYYWSVSE